jgi:hypothetical protein
LDRVGSRGKVAQMPARRVERSSSRELATNFAIRRACGGERKKRQRRFDPDTATVTFSSSLRRSLSPTVPCLRASSLSDPTELSGPSSSYFSLAGGKHRACLRTLGSRPGYSAGSRPVLAPLLPRNALFLPNVDDATRTRCIHSTERLNRSDEMEGMGFGS